MFHVLESFVRYIESGSSSDEEEFVRHASRVLDRLRSSDLPTQLEQASHLAVFMHHEGFKEEDVYMKQFFDSLRSIPLREATEMLNDARRKLVVSRATSSVDIASVVFSCSIIWADDRRLDFVIAPSAGDGDEKLTLKYVSSAFPWALDRFLEQLALQGLDAAREHDAYVVDDLRCSVILNELDRFVAGRSGDDRKAFASIVDRIRMSLFSFSRETAKEISAD